MEKYDSLKLENQLCFPLYACSKEIIRKYKPFLDKIDLTYTQYIVMMALWEKGKVNVSELGKCLYLDSGTLTPVIKTLEKKNYLVRARDSKDERVVFVSLTDQGMALRDQALAVPEQMGGCIKLEKDEAMFLYKILYKILGNIETE